MNYEIDKDDKRLLIIRFNDKSLMNNTLSKISERYEGLLVNAEGYNFPASYVTKSDKIYDFVRGNKIEYIIGVYNFNSIQHEKLHAKYYLDETYKNKINKEWKELDETIRNHITAFLKKLGYCDKVLIDEYQAYRYTEKNNFFGVKLVS
jgi:mRNA-degrading endonuclease RelE of RelBE toxin-antitoxin system